MERDPRAWLWDVCQAADRVAEFVSGQDFADHLADVKLRSAIERQLEIVREALNNLSREAPELASRIPDARRVIAMRNVLVHAYRNIDNDPVWQTIQVDLPRLRLEAAALLTELGETPQWASAV